MILTDTMFWRLVWKEYRAQRGFWLVIAGTTIGLMLVALSLPDKRTPGSNWFITLLMPTLYALGSAATVFASEKEEGTTDLLRIMAARPSRVFFGKAAFSLISTLAMWTCLLSAAWTLNWWYALPPLDAEASVVSRLLALAAVTGQLLAWGFLYSALCKRALTAVCLTAVGSTIFLLIALERIEPRQFVIWDMFQGDPPSRTWGSFCLLSSVPLLAAAYFLTSRTMAGRTFHWSMPRLPWRRTSATVQLDRLAAVQQSAPAWQRLYTRLIWLELRHALTLGHLLWIFGLLVVVCLLLGIIGGSPSAQRDRGIIGIVLSALLLGVWSFQAEGGRRTRFLADQGLSPHAIWLSKQLVWGMFTIAVTAALMLMVVIANQLEVWNTGNAGSSIFHPDLPGASAVTFAAILACLGYATGQFASMLIPRGVTAGFIAYAVFALLGFWTWLMVNSQVPLSISIAPLVILVIFMLGVTFFWSRHWLLESATWRSWTRLALLAGATLILVWAGIGAFRVYEVPRPDFVYAMDALRQEHTLPNRSEELKTAALYRQAFAHLKWENNERERKEQRDWQGRARHVRAWEPGNTEKEEQPKPRVPTAVDGWEYATEIERRMLAENQDALQEGLAATKRFGFGCMFDDPSQPNPDRFKERLDPSLDDIRHLATLILLSARELEAGGQLDKALDRYLAVLRLAGHVARHGTMREWMDGADLEAMVGQWIPGWAAHADQTSKRINAAVFEIGMAEQFFPPLEDALLTQQFLIRRFLRDDWLAFFSKSQDPAQEARSRMALMVFDRLCPWERARTRRVWDLVDAAQLHCLDVLDHALAYPGYRDMQQWAESADAHLDAGPTQAKIDLPRHATSRLFRPGDFFAPQPAGANHQERLPWNWLKTTIPLDITFSRAAICRGSGKWDCRAN